jgi:hypothetical protein
MPVCAPNTYASASSPFCSLCPNGTDTRGTSSNVDANGCLGS